jgi:hypothetical protein
MKTLDHLGAPVTFLAGAPQQDLATGAGSLPKTEAAALERINALLPQGAAPLSGEQVWIHYAEALNSSFVGDRYMWIGDSTLRNYAKDAAQGFSFLNSHRSGGDGNPAELPYGKTFAGRYEDTGTARRTLVGLYMLRGVSPAGAGGPSTDDVHEMIRGGTLADVSAGLKGGEPLCDVCGQDLMELSGEGFFLCPHMPGMSIGMSSAEQERQLLRGVPKGGASFTYERGRGSELSGVYDGAVTGAGFRFVAGGATGLEVIAAKLSVLLDRPNTREGQTFAAHSETVLTTVEEYLDRAEAYLGTRAASGQPATAGRLADWEALAARLARVIALGRPKADPARLAALRVRLLKHRSADLLRS